MSGAYNHPNYGITRHIIDPKVTGASSATMQKYLLFAASRIRSINWLVLTAGTNTDAGIDVYLGTTSVAALTYGTSTAGSIIKSGALSISVPDDSMLELKGKANSATAVGSVNIEYQMQFNAQET